jgi:uncharacterized protein YbaR (Trm112 family)
MHILLTDILVCPRCGPQHGLILLADRLEERRVLDGWLGCANCREHFPLVHGALDLRIGPGAREEVPIPAYREDGAAWLAALMGLAGISGTVAVIGGGAELAPALATLVPDVEVVTLTEELLVGKEPSGVSRIAVNPMLPFRTGSLRALAFTGGAEMPWADALRVVAPGGRLVVEGATGNPGAALRELGAEVLLDQDGVVVARPAAV